MSGELGQPPMVDVDIVLDHAERRLPVRVEVPTQAVDPMAVLPALHRIASTLVEAAEADTAERGKPVSCHKGCGACCRQLVPISTIEAHAIMSLVTSLPEDRRRRVESRFESNLAVLAQTGLGAKLKALMVPGSTDDRALGFDYLGLRLPCPFLEDESCSIHPDRPLVCREYLVTSPPSACAAIEGPNVDPVPMPALWRPLAQVADQSDSSPNAPKNGRIFLVFALEWARANPPRYGLRPGADWVAAYAQAALPPPADTGPADSEAAQARPQRERVSVSLTLPPGEVSAEALLPSLWRMMDVPLRMATQRLESSGKQVSCKAGCGACCRQRVPITLVEARHLSSVIAAMPAPLRQRVIDRFAAAEAQIGSAALSPAITTMLERQTPEEATDGAYRYFGLGIPCPFLEEESCSIHAERPLVCREYFVSSPSERCARLGSADAAIDPVPVPQFSEALDAISEASSEGGRRFALTIFRRVLASAPAPATKPAQEWLGIFLTNLKSLEGRDMHSPSAAARDTAQR